MQFLISVTFSVGSNMETRNGPGTSRDGPYGENDMMRILQGMMNSQQQTDRALAIRIADCTPGAETGYYIEFQEITADRIFGHGEAPGCRAVVDRYDRSSEGGQNSW